MQFDSIVRRSLLAMVCLSSSLWGQDTSNSRAARRPQTAADQAGAIKRLQSAVAKIQYKNGLADRIRFPARNVNSATLVDITSLGRLTSLDLTGSNISDIDLEQLQKMTLIQLHLAETAITDAGMQQIARMKQLMLLNIENTNVGDAGIEHIAEMPTLGDMRLRGTRITNVGIRRLQSLKKLWRLSLGGSEIKDETVIQLANLRFVSSLSLHDASISDAGLKPLAAMRKLKQLTLAGTNVTEKGVAELKRSLPNLTVYRSKPAKPRPVPVRAASTPTSAAKTSGRHVSGKSSTNGAQPAGSPDNEKRDAALARFVSPQEAIRQLTELGAEIEMRGDEAIRVAFNGDNSHLTDEDLAVIKSLTEVENLNLSGTGVSDALLRHFTHLKKLRVLRLYKTNVTWIGIAELEKSLPQLKPFATTPSHPAPRWMFYSTLIAIPAFLFAAGAFLNVIIRLLRSIQSLRKMPQDGTAMTVPQIWDAPIRNALCLAAQSIAVFFTVIGIPFVIEGTDRILTASATESWPTVDGEVAVSRVIARSTFDSDSGTSGTAYEAIIIYRYMVDGTQHTGHRIAYYRLGNDNSRSADKQYPAGEPVKVSYNPADPSDAVLQPGAGPENFIRVGLGAIATLVGVLLFLGAHMKRNRVKAEAESADAKQEWVSDD